MSDPETGELIAEQRARERAEQEQAHGSDLEAERHVHERRAAKAAYLEERLEERAESEIREDEA